MGSCEAALATGAAKPRGGRPRVLGKAALENIIYILKSGVPWRMLPKEFGCSGVTCWRCLRGWQEAGVWRRVRRLLLNKLGRLGLWIGLKCRWTRQAYRPKRLERTAPNPVDCDRPGSKCHLLVDRVSTPLAVWLTRAAVHHLKVFETLIEGLA